MTRKTCTPSTHVRYSSLGLYLRPRNPEIKSPNFHDLRVEAPTLAWRVSADHVDARAEGTSDGRAVVGASCVLEAVPEKATVPVLEDSVVVNGAGAASFFLVFRAYLRPMPLE